MPGVIRPASTVRWLGLSALLLLNLGCQFEETLEGSGVSLRLPSGWSSEPLERWPVPGEPMGAWRSSPEMSLVVYRALPIPGGTAESVAEALSNRLTNLPGMRVEVKTTETHTGVQFARVEAVAPGTGTTLAPTGAGTPTSLDGRELVPTRRVTLGVVRPADTIYLTWHAPESARERLAQEIESVLREIRIEMPSPSSSSY